MSYRPAVILAACLCSLPYSTHAEKKPESRISLWLNNYHGDVTTFATVMQDLEKARVVYLGETHRIKRHHEWQLRIVHELARRGKKVIIGMEQIEEQYAADLARFNKGDMDFEALAQAIDWAQRWRNYESYQALVEFAQSQDFPLLALNAKAETIRAIGRGGLTSLSTEQRATLPDRISWEEDAVYRQLLDKIMMVHMPVTSEKLTPFFQAQVARDENMAENLANALRDQPADTIAVVIAGSGHINYGLGMPPRVQSRLGKHIERIVCFTNSAELVLTPEEEAMRRDVTLTPDDLRFINRPRSDYLLITQVADELP